MCPLRLLLVSSLSHRAGTEPGRKVAASWRASPPKRLVSLGMPTLRFGLSILHNLNIGMIKHIYFEVLSFTFSLKPENGSLWNAPLPRCVQL